MLLPSPLKVAVTLKTLPFSVKENETGTPPAVTVPAKPFVTVDVARHSPPKPVALRFCETVPSDTNAICVPLAAIWPSGCSTPFTRTCPSVKATSMPVNEPLFDRATNSHGPAILGMAGGVTEDLLPPQPSRAPHTTARTMDTTARTDLGISQSPECKPKSMALWGGPKG